MSIVQAILTGLILSHFQCTHAWNSYQASRCHDAHITCPCGQNGTTVQVAVQKCLEKDFETGKKSCVICNKHFIDGEFCEKFMNCDTCSNGVNRCVSCPLSKTGPFCTEEDEDYINFDQQNFIYPFSITIKGSDSNSIGHRMLREAGCSHPTNMDTSDLHCTFYVEKVICLQICIWGHTLLEGKQKELRCLYKQNVWKPSEFEACQPYINCNILFKTAGEMFCTYNRRDSGPSCDLACYEYDDQPEMPLSRYDCLLTGEYNPPLPHCIVKSTTEILAPPPKVEYGHDDFSSHEDFPPVEFHQSDYQHNAF